MIREASHKIPRDECLAISFIQVGKDNGARRFLKKLDDDLKGCQFDIVDTKVGNVVHTEYYLPSNSANCLPSLQTELL